MLILQGGFHGGECGGALCLSEVKVQIADREATMAVTEAQAEKMFR